MTHDEKIVEAVARALCRRQIVSNLRWEKEPATPEFIQRCEDVGWQSGEWIDQARAAITAYQAEAWRPIETAPKDGTRVLVWFSYSAEERARARVPGREEAARWSVHCGAWMLDHDACDEGHAPTHWQPLPNPPASP